MTPSTATAADIDAVCAAPITVTLLDLVSELSATGATDGEIVAAVMDLLKKGRMRLIGQVCDEDLLAH